MTAGSAFPVQDPATPSTAPGRLKIFFGMCPGVGKTYAMLLGAQQRQEEGTNVLIGVIETHGRIETQALTAGLARVPLREVSHRGVTLREMDLDAILARRPELVLVDELAHSNAPGSRHPKRCQDVIELLDAGIDVFTTMNVQHLESRRDVVAQIIGAPVRETVPDSILDRAVEIELVDVSPSELRKRLDEGKVYLGDRAATASENFFREENLKALREIVLRVTADRADQELRVAMQGRRAGEPWKARERLLVAVGPSPYSARLIRWTRHYAAAVHGLWLAVYVDTGRSLDDETRGRLEENLTLARSLGGEVFTTTGEDVAETILRAAREHQVTQIVAGKPLSPRWLDVLRGGSLVDRLIRSSGDIDIHVVRADKTAAPWRPSPTVGPKFFRGTALGGLLVVALALGGLVVAPLIGYAGVGLLFLLAVLLSSLVLSRGPVLATAALSALAWNFFFIPPRFTFSIATPQDLILFGMYFVVALVLGQFTSRLRLREAVERRREEQATALYRFSLEVAGASSIEEAMQAAAARISSLLGAETGILGADLACLGGGAIPERDRAVADWALRSGRAAGRFTDTLPQAHRLHLPLMVSGKAVGVLWAKPRAAFTLPERQLLETFANQLGVLLERERLRAEASRAEVETRSQRLQKTLLDSVSHEFRTPLAVINGAAVALETSADVPGLAGEIRAAAIRLGRIVGDLLDITRIESGAVRPKWEWMETADLLAGVMERHQAETGGRRVEVAVEEGAAYIRSDAALLGEIVGNLLRNAAQHSPEGSLIVLRTAAVAGQLRLVVTDEGTGLSTQDEEQIFRKFHRGNGSKSGGLGLGLSIVRGFAEALGGEVSAGLRGDGRPGAEFRVTLPAQPRAEAPGG